MTAGSDSLAAGEWDAAVAEWLAGLFLAPLPLAAVVSFREGFEASLLDELERQPGCTQGVRAMKAVLANGEPTALTRQLGIAFMQLFEGTGGPRTVSPFESAHAGAGGRLFQAPAQDMDRLLSTAGLRLTRGAHEPADHLSVELALLAHMMRDPGQRHGTASFLERRLLAWVPGFAEAVGTADPAGFYAGAASVLAGFLAEQRRALGGDGPVHPVRTGHYSGAPA